MELWLHDSDVDGMAGDERAEECCILKHGIVWSGLCFAHLGIIPPHVGVGMGRAFVVDRPFSTARQTMGCCGEGTPPLFDSCYGVGLTSRRRKLLPLAHLVAGCSSGCHPRAGASDLVRPGGWWLVGRIRLICGVV